MANNLTTNNELNMAWKAFLKSPMLLIFFTVMVLLGYVVNTWVVKDLKEQIKELKGENKVWELRQQDWILRRDQLQQQIIDISRTAGFNKALDSIYTKP